MFEKDNLKLGYKELFSIYLFSIAIKCTESTSLVFIKSGETGAWVMPIISYLIILIPFHIIRYLLKINKNKGLIEIINESTGKYIGFFINNILLIIILASVIISSKSYINILNALYFPKTPIVIIYLLLILLSAYATYKGIHIIGRACLIALPFMSFIGIILIISIYKEMDYRLALPILGTGSLTLLKKSFQYSSILGDVIILSIFYSYTKSYLEYKKASNRGLIVTAIIISFIYFSFMSTFGIGYLKILNYPFHELVRTAKLGDTLHNIDAFFLSFWLIGVVFHLSIYFSFLIFIFNKIYKLNNEKLPLILLSIVIFFLGMQLKDENQTVHIYRSIQLTVSSYLIFIIPFILLIINKLKGGRNK